MSSEFGKRPGVPTQLKAGGDIRLVVATGCQSGCNFCHLEGHKTSNEIGQLNPALIGWKDPNKKFIPLIDKLGNAARSADVQSAIAITKKLGMENIHLTGGEPTLHPDILSTITQIREAGLTVALTTHGEINPSRFEEILQSGVNSINFSLHAITPEQYMAMDLIAQRKAPEEAYKYARVRLNNKHTNIRRAVEYEKENADNFKVKTNTVVLNTETTKEIINWCNQEGVSPRIQRDLNHKEDSQVIINQVIADLDANPIREDIAIGDSSGSGTLYEYSGGQFKVKEFGDIYIDEMCNECEKKDTPGCREHFYGVRVEGEGRVSTCIDVQVPGVTVFSQEDFLQAKSGVPVAIAKQYIEMEEELQKKE